MAILNKIDNWVERIKTMFKTYPYLILIALAVFIGGSIFISDAWARHMQFNGIIEGVTYDFRKAPTVRIGGKDYYLNFGSSPKNIEVGDKLIKKRGEIRILLIKFNSKDTVDSTKPYPEKK